MRVGVADTTFARVDMGALVVEMLLKADKKIEIERSTVPGCKDLAVASKKLIEEFDCDIVLALGWVGKEEIDERCAHEANLGLIQASAIPVTNDAHQGHEHELFQAIDGLFPAALALILPSVRLHTQHLFSFGCIILMSMTLTPRLNPTGICFSRIIKVK